MSHQARLEDLKRKISRQETLVRDQKARLKKLTREADTRRKIIYGVAFLALLDDLNEDQRVRALNRIHDKITRPSDRAFLGLPPLSDIHADDDASSE